MEKIDDFGANKTGTQADEGRESFDSLIKGLIPLTLVAAFAGLFVGLIGGSFRWMLEYSGTLFSGMLTAWRDQSPAQWMPGWLLAMLIGATCVALARSLIRMAPEASGSGVQHVEAVMRHEASPARFRVLPIKYIGGILAMAPGMALGREGPTIQMAGVIGHVCGQISKLARADQFMLYTAVAGAGLSVAFNAPLAGAAGLDRRGEGLGGLLVALVLRGDVLVGRADALGVHRVAGHAAGFLDDGFGGAGGGAGAQGEHGD